MCDNITDVTVGLPREILLQLLEVLGVNVGHYDFDDNINDVKLRPSFRPECILVSLKDDLVKIGGVFLEGGVDFVQFLQGSEVDGAFGSCWEG